MWNIIANFVMTMKNSVVYKFTGFIIFYFKRIVFIFNSTVFKYINCASVTWSEEYLLSNSAVQVQLLVESGILIATLEVDMCPFCVYCPVWSLTEACNLPIPDPGTPVIVLSCLVVKWCSSLINIWLSHWSSMSLGVQVLQGRRVNDKLNFNWYSIFTHCLSRRTQRWRNSFKN